MKITSLQVENVKRLKAVEIKPDGSLVIVGGKNGAGKSSVLDSIAYAIGGKDLCPTMPIRKGEENAVVRVTLDDLVIERTWTPKGSYLKVTNAAGFKTPSPQALLDALVGRLTFDPLAFARLSDTAEGRRKQAAILREVYGLDFSEEEQKSKMAFDERTGLNRDLKAEQARLAGTPKVEAPDEEISISDAIGELEAARKRNADGNAIGTEIQTATSTRTATNETLAVERKRVTGLECQLKAAKDAVAKTEKKITDQDAAIETLARRQAEFQFTDAAPLEKKVADAETTNSNVRQNRERSKLSARVKNLEEKVAAQTAIIEDCESTKQMKLSEAQFPIEGLSVDSDGVTLSGVPLDQASQAEQLRLSVAIGLAQNPKLKVLLIRDGSLLDENGLKLIGEAAEKSEAQVWIERVTNGGVEEGAVSVVIEDGMVKGAPKGADAK